MKQIAKKVVTLSLCLLLTLVLFAGCTPANNGGTTAPPASTAGTAPTASAPADATATPEANPYEGKIIGFSMHQTTSNWVQAMRHGVVTTCEKLGIELVINDAEEKAEKQVSDLEDLIARKVDVILISTYAAQAIAPVTQQAIDAGIPVVVMSSDIPGVTPTVHVSCDSFATGQSAALKMMELNPEGGTVVHFNGLPGSIVNNMRKDGYYDKIDLEKYPEFFVEAEYKRDLAMNGMEDFLQTGKDFIGVYAHNDDMCMGAIQAIRAHGLNPADYTIIGVDGIDPNALDTIEKGDFTGTFFYITFGVEGVEAAAAIMRGETPEAKQIIDSPWIDKTNVAAHREALGIN